MYSSKIPSLQDPCVGVWGLMPVLKGAWLSFVFETRWVPSVKVQKDIVRDLTYLSDNDGHIQLIFMDMKCVNGVYQVLVTRKQTQQPLQWVVVTDSDGVPLPIDLNLITLQVWNGKMHVTSADNEPKIISDVVQRVTAGKTLQGVVRDMYPAC